MSKEFSRALRVAEQLQRELAVLVQQEIKDPRIGMVTISTVKVSKDLAHAKVFVTVLGDEKESAGQSVEILNRASPFLRHALGQRMVMRIIPVLRFVYDETLESGQRLANLIDISVAADKKKSGNKT